VNFLLVLIKLSYEDNRNLRDIFVPLASRLQDANWVSIFKSLLLFYRLFRDGATKRIYDDVCMKMGFNFAHLYRFRDAKRTLGKYKKEFQRELDANGFLGPYQSLYIQHFAKYLDAKIASYGKLGLVDYTCMDDGTSMKKLRELPIDGRLVEIGRLLVGMLDAALSTPITPSLITTEITLTAFRCLVKDILRYYHGLNELVIHMLDKFFSIQNSEVVTDMLALYQRMVRVTENVIDFLGAAKKIQHYLSFHVPVLVPAPKALETHLKEYLALLKSQDASLQPKNSLPSGQDCDLFVQNQSQLLIDFDCEEVPVRLSYIFFFV
jgi:phosphatidylinositol-binding clathrin assembly protein